MMPELPKYIASLLILGAAALSRADDQPIPYGPVSIPPAKPTKVIPQRLVSLIATSLAHTTDTGLRVRLTGDLAAVGNEAAKSELLQLLKDSDPLVRAQAVSGLPGSAEGEALHVDPSAVVRRAVVAANPTDAVLLKAYDDADPAVRDTAFGQSSSSQTDARLAALLARQDSSRQAIICRTLAARKAIACAASIQPLLDSAALPAHIAAIHALAALGRLSAEQLRPQLTHAHPTVRQAAAASLTSLTAAERLSPAILLLSDGDLGVRAAAVAVLGEVAAAPAVDELLKQFIPEDPELTAATRAALAAIAERDSYARTAIDSAAAALLVAPTPLLRCDGSFLLGKLKSNTQLSRHLGLLKDADWTVVRQAAMSLGAIADPSAAAPLAESAALAAGINDPTSEQWSLSASASEVVARAEAGEQAILACVKLHYAPVIEAVRPVILKKTASFQIRTAAIWAIGVLDPPQSAAAPLRALIGRSNDIEEIPAVIAEAIKAAGNSKAAALRSSLLPLKESTRNLEYSVAATMALDRIDGTQTPIFAPESPFTPQTAVTDLTPAAR